MYSNFNMDDALKIDQQLYYNQRMVNGLMIRN
jgi:hypothetical protein